MSRCAHGDKRSECHRCHVDRCSACHAHPTSCTCMVPPVDSDHYDAMRLFGLASASVWSNFRQTEWFAGALFASTIGPFPTRAALAAALRDGVIQRRRAEADGGRALLGARLQALLEGSADERECRACGEPHGAAEGVAS